MNFGRQGLFFAAAMALCAVAKDAVGFTHVVKPGETLAQIALSVYGDAKFEKVLVGANALDIQGGVTIAPGMPLEIPAPRYHRVTAGETWFDIAVDALGDKKRSEMLARANNGVNWVPPVEGKEILIFPVIAHIAGENETVNTIWDRYMADPTRAWELNSYNNREGVLVRRGEVVLVPFEHLRLSEQGKAEARRAAGHEQSQGGSTAYDTQRRAEPELPQLLSDIRYGRYSEAVARANRVLGMAVLTQPDLAVVYRALLEAYVALDAPALASQACASWRTNDPHPRLDAVSVSPKIRAACGAQ